MVLCVVRVFTRRVLRCHRKGFRLTGVHDIPLLKKRTDMCGDCKLKILEPAAIARTRSLRTRRAESGPEGLGKRSNPFQFRSERANHGALRFERKVLACACQVPVTGYCQAHLHSSSWPLVSRLESKLQAGALRAENEVGGGEWQLLSSKPHNARIQWIRKLSRSSAFVGRSWKIA